MSDHATQATDAEIADYRARTDMWMNRDAIEIRILNRLAQAEAERDVLRQRIGEAEGLLILLMAWLDPRVIQHLECQGVYTCQLCCEKFAAGEERHKSGCPYQATRAYLAKHTAEREKGE